MSLPKKLAGCLAGLVLWSTPILAQTQPVSLNQNIVAEVDGVLITREQLAEELIARKGKAQLEALVNRTMIEQACKAKGITVTDREVQEELLAQVKAGAFASISDFEKSMLRPQRTTLFEFKEDVLRPKLMVQKLAAARLALTDEDLRKEFARCYGEKVACRIIAFQDAQLAKKVWSEIAGKPENFIRYAKLQADRDLAASAGMLSPFGRHTTHDNIEQRAFSMQEGEVSEVLQTQEQGYVIILKEHHLPARTDVTFEDKKEELRRVAQERKLQSEVPKVVQDLKKQYQDKIRYHLEPESDLKRLLEQYQNTLGTQSPSAPVPPGK